jgi:hypothetical protein
MRALALFLALVALAAVPTAAGQSQGQTREPKLTDLWSEYPLDQTPAGIERLQSRERDGSIAGPPPRDPSPGGPIALGILYAGLAVFTLFVIVAIRRLAAFPRRRRASGSSP